MTTMAFFTPIYIYINISNLSDTFRAKAECKIPSRFFGSSSEKEIIERLHDGVITNKPCS
jgi:hypothetical protein